MSNCSPEPELKLFVVIYSSKIGTSFPSFDFSRGDKRPLVRLALLDNFDTITFVQTINLKSNLFLSLVTSPLSHGNWIFYQVVGSIWSLLWCIRIIMVRRSLTNVNCFPLALINARFLCRSHLFSDLDICRWYISSTLRFSIGNTSFVKNEVVFLVSPSILLFLELLQAFGNW